MKETNGEEEAALPTTGKQEDPVPEKALEQDHSMSHLNRMD